MRRHFPCSRIPAAAGPLRRGEEGFAMVAVLVLGACLIALSSVIVLRGTRAVGNTSGDARWERALPVAEEGLEMGLQALELDAEFSTTDGYPAFFASPQAERAWVVAAAGAASGGDLVTTPVGEYVVVKPVGVNLLYAVGYSPSREAFGGRTRVVRIGYELHEVLWDLEYALLVGDDLELGGDSTVEDSNSNDNANVHANGEVSTQGSWEIEGCLTSSDQDTDLPSEPGCPPNPVPPELISSIDPAVLYQTANVVLCPDGKAYAGPAYSGDPAIPADDDLIPCDETEDADHDGQVDVNRQLPLAGWSSKVKGGVREWDPKNATGGAVYYVHQANVVGKVGGDLTFEMTLLISSATGGTCSGKSTGNLELAGNSVFRTAPGMLAAGYDLAVIAQGDIYYRGGAAVIGTQLAHEQIDYKGNSDSYGAVVAESFCDTSGSPVSISVLSGNSFLSFPGKVKTPFTSLRWESEVIAWHEL
jgi:hypothetical protein